MKIRAVETVLAVLIAILIIVAKIKSADVKPDNVREPYVIIETETETETEVEFIHDRNFTFLVPIERETVTAMPQFSGYGFIPLSADEQIIIKDICDKYELAYDLMLAIAKQESAYDMSAHNPVSDDWGMWQINVSTWDSTANEMGLYDYRTDISHNAEMACYIVRYCLDMANGDLRVALNYYRTGTPYNKYEADSDYASIVMNNINENKKKKMGGL